jgi:hypothetical protein
MAESNLKVARPLTAVTPVHSSLTGLLRDYLLGLFPRGYFRDYFVNTELPFRPGIFGNRRGRFRPMEGANVQQMKYPFLSVRVEPSADVSQLGSLDSFWQGRQFLRPSGLFPIFMDDLALRYLSYERERLICRFSVSMLAQTDLQGNEILMYLKRTMPIDRLVYLRGATIWSKVPTEIVGDVYADLGLGPEGTDADMASLRAYLGAVSAGRLQQTIDSATGRVSFSFPYRSNPVFRVQGAPSISVTREGGVVRYSEVSFSVEMDLEVPISYVYRQEPRLAPPGPAPDGITADGNTAYFGITIDLAPPTVMAGPGGTPLTLVYFTGLVTGPPDPSGLGRPDVTAIGPSIQPELKNYIAGIVGGPTDPSLQLQLVVKMGSQAVAPAAYSMDWGAWELSLLPPDLLYNQQYQVLIYCDLTGYAAATPDNTGRAQAPSPMYTEPSGAPQTGTP